MFTLECNISIIQDQWNVILSHENYDSVLSFLQMHYGKSHLSELGILQVSPSEFEITYVNNLLIRFRIMKDGIPYSLSTWKIGL